MIDTTSSTASNLPVLPRSFQLTQLGNAERLVAAHSSQIRFCPPLNRWFTWSGRRWEADETGQIYRLAMATVRAIYQEAAGCEDTEARSRLSRHAQRSEARSEIEAMIGLARYQSGISILPSQFDSDRLLLNCLNGTLDLRASKLKPHDRNDLLTKLAPVKYDPLAKCPQWLTVLSQLFKGNEMMLSFLQRLVGYTLTGEVTEKALFLFVGDGDNGKTTLLEVLRFVMGDYAGVVDINVLMKKPNGDNAARERAVAGLIGLRFVTSSETEEGQKLNEQLIKQLTGMGVQQGRRIYGSEFQFVPLFKLFIDANHKPQVRGTDPAIWNRMRLIPFDVSIPKTAQDKDLRSKLIAEASGILAWAVEGCLKWQAEGLGSPDAVGVAVQQYREQMDIVAEFIADCCVVELDARVAFSDLYQAFKAWCLASDERPLTATQLGRRLSEKQFEATSVQGSRGRKGLMLKLAPGEPEPATPS